MLAADGSFRADDVPPGAYRVQVMLMKADPSRPGGIGGRMISGPLAADIVVPASALNRVESLDLGAVPLKPGSLIAN